MYVADAGTAVQISVCLIVCSLAVPPKQALEADEVSRERQRWRSLWAEVAEWKGNFYCELNPLAVYIKSKLNRFWCSGSIF